MFVSAAGSPAQSSEGSPYGRGAAAGDRPGYPREGDSRAWQAEQVACHEARARSRGEHAPRDRGQPVCPRHHPNRNDSGFTHSLSIFAVSLIGTDWRGARGCSRSYCQRR